MAARAEQFLSRIYNLIKVLVVADTRAWTRRSLRPLYKNVVVAVEVLVLMLVLTVVVAVCINFYDGQIHTVDL